MRCCGFKNIQQRSSTIDYRLSCQVPRTIVIYAKARLTESINTSNVDIAQFSHATTQYVTPSKALAVVLTAYVPTYS